MLEFLPIGLSLFAVGVATYTDLKKRIIPDVLTLPLFFFGLVFNIARGLVKQDPVLIAGAMSGYLAFGLGYILWLTGGWAGGDVKLFAALGALLPLYKPPFCAASYPFFMTIFFNSVISAAAMIFAYALVRWRRTGRFEGILCEEIEVSELKEGMILAQAICVNDGKIVKRKINLFGFGLKEGDRLLIDPRAAAGLTKEQVRGLKRLAEEGKLKGKIKIRKGMPYAPALALGLVISLVYGDLYWRFLLALKSVV